MSVHVIAASCACGSLALLSCFAGFECKMAEWHTILDQLEFPDGAVSGLSASDKPVLRGKLLQLPAADSWFVGQPREVLKTLRSLPSVAPSGQAQRLFIMISLCGLLQLAASSKSVYHNKPCSLFGASPQLCCASPDQILWVFSLAETLLASVGFTLELNGIYSFLLIHHFD